MNNQVIHRHCQHAPCTWFKALLYFPHFRSKLYRSSDERIIITGDWGEKNEIVADVGKGRSPRSLHWHWKYQQIDGQHLQTATINLFSSSAITSNAYFDGISCAWKLKSECKRRRNLIFSHKKLLNINILISNVLKYKLFNKIWKFLPEIREEV